MRTNYIRQGKGAPVILIHGLAASLHDWDGLVPVLARSGYAAYAPDLLGHGESDKPSSRLYEIDWVSQQLSAWIDSLELQAAPVLVGHSLGGYLAIDFARRFPGRVRALVLVNPFYRLAQLPSLLRLTYKQPSLNLALIGRAPAWLLRIIIDAASLSIGHSNGGAHHLPEHIREQTALDYHRTAAGVYYLPNSLQNLQPYLRDIKQPCLLVYGSRDMTLSPASFIELAAALPNAMTRILHAGHVPHQSHIQEFNRLVLDFLAGLSLADSDCLAPGL